MFVNIVTFIIVSLLFEVLFVELSLAMPSKDRARKIKKKELNKSYYEINKDSLLSDRKEKYSKDDRSKRHNDDYYADVMASRIKSLELDGSSNILVDKI